MKPRTRQQRNADRRIAMEARRANRGNQLVESADRKKVPEVVQDLTPVLQDIDLANLHPDEAKAQIGKAVSDYFKQQDWSIEKEEWENHMSPKQKGAFVDSFYNRLLNSVNQGPGNPKDEDEGENSTKYCVYFDYTGAGRSPEPIAGPFNTEQEANNYVRENNLTGKDYFVDVYHEK